MAYNRYIGSRLNSARHNCNPGLLQGPITTHMSSVCLLHSKNSSKSSKDAFPSEQTDQAPHALDTHELFQFCSPLPEEKSTGSSE